MPGSTVRTAGPLLAFTIFSFATAGSVAAEDERGRILVPVGPEAPPLFANSGHGYAWYFMPALAGASYELEPAVTSCIHPDCQAIELEVCAIGDFDVAWFTDSGDLISTDSSVGPERGTVPPNAGHGVVWMRCGPHYDYKDIPLGEGTEFIVRYG